VGEFHRRDKIAVSTPMVTWDNFSVTFPVGRNRAHLVCREHSVPF